MNLPSAEPTGAAVRPRIGATRIGAHGPETYCRPGFWMQDADPRDRLTEDDDGSEHGPEIAANEHWKESRRGR